MAQGFRARMNNFHSVLIEVLNTAQMMNYEKFSDAVTYFSFMRRPSQAQPAQFNVVSLHSRYLSMSCAINQVSWTRSERLPEYVIAGTHLSRFRYLWLP